jgi:hopanoid biosynthesis associated radical SAM protein HpnJ
MASVMKTLFLNPPSFEGFDGGAGARWPATREIASFWYPVWLAYPAGMLPGSRLLDAPPAGISKDETIKISSDYDFVVLFTSNVGFYSDIDIARRMKELKPSLKIAFVGPDVQTRPAECLKASPHIDFVVRGEFDYATVEFAQGKPLSQIAGASYLKDGEIVHNPGRPYMETAELDKLPYATEVYARDLKIENYNIPFLLHPYVSFYTSRGCPALCTFCHWPQTLSGHAWRVRSTDNVVTEFKQAMKLFPQAKEFFFDDDTFNIRKDRVLDVCSKLKPLGFRWSANARTHTDYDTLKAMADAGCRLLIVGFESGDAQILKNIKKGTTPEMGLKFMENCKKVGIIVHADFIIGLPGETKETIAKTIDYAKQLDADTVQVSVAHAYPGTELYEWAAKNNYLATEQRSDHDGHQLPHLVYPGLSLEDMMAGMNTFYDSYYLRPHVIWRIVKKALWDSHERKRLYVEAKEYLRVRGERWKYARQGHTQPDAVSQLSNS